MLRLEIVLICLILASGGVVKAAPPAFMPQPARLLQIRAGLGNVLSKLQAGQDVRIAYFGGSITAAPGWRVKTFAWLQQRYPQARITEINAAIGGTGSDLGVFRFRQDVLSKKPDLIFVEFSVNDGGMEPLQIWRAMEGIIRQAWRENPEIDICYVYTFRVGYEKDLEQGICPRAASADEMLAEYYGIPSLNLALRIVQLQQEGKLIYVSPKNEAGQPLPGPEGQIIFSDDGVHPLEAGHQIYADVITASILQMEASAKPHPHALKPPFVEDNWEQARMESLQPSMLSTGWKKLEPNNPFVQRFGHFMPEIWEATQPGEKIHFRFRGSQARLYDIVGPDGGQVVVTLDGRSSPPIPRFDSYCTYHRLQVLALGQNLDPSQIHEVIVEIHPEQPDRSSVVEREKNKPGFDPRKYEGTAFRVGSILLLGELVP